MALCKSADECCVVACCISQGMRRRICTYIMECGWMIKLNHRKNKKSAHTNPLAEQHKAGTLGIETLETRLSLASGATLSPIEAYYAAWYQSHYQSTPTTDPTNVPNSGPWDGVTTNGPSNLQAVASPSNI